MESLSRQQQAVRALDPYHGLREALGQIASQTAEWAGLPLPIGGHRLIIAPQMPFAAKMQEAGLAGHTSADLSADDPDVWRVRNRFYSRRWRATIVVIERDGRVRCTWEPGFHHLEHDMLTLGASCVWGLEQEQRALQLLGRMVRHHQMRQYVLTGMLLERSVRSGVTYLFRRLKPTVALAPSRPGQESEPCRILASLCQHPIAYYEGSWAGAMCPTDDVIAHLALMRADEPMFWKRSTQHPPYLPEAGL